MPELFRHPIILAAHLAQAAPLAVVFLALGSGEARGVVLGTAHTFEDGTIMNWIGGTDRTNVAGGPGGAADRFLRVQTTATSSAGSHLATHNRGPEWSGDYLGAGVTGVQADLRNLGSTQLTMRLVFFSLGTRWTSTTPVVLPAGGGWTRVTFPIGPSDLTRALGTNTYAQMISSVDGIMFRHDLTPSSQGDPINGTLGIDNLLAIPGPGTAGAVGLLAGLGALRRRR